MTRLTVLLLIIFSIPVYGQEKPLSILDMMAMKRLSAFSVSPDGNRVVFSAGEVKYADNKVVSDLYLLDRTNNSVKKLTENAGSNFNPVFSKDSTTIYYLSTRIGLPQIFTLNLSNESVKRITNFSMGVNTFILNPDESAIAFASDVFPDCLTDSCNQAMDQKRSERKATGQLFDSLPFRVWDSFKNGMRSHVYMFDLQSGRYRNLTPGNYDTPPIDLGGSQDFSFSADGRQFWFVRNADKKVAWSTNNDIFMQPLSGGNPVNVTEVNNANDHSPLPSPDGRFLAYLAMKRPGFEADRTEIILRNMETGEIKSLTAGMDRSASDITWSRDGKHIWFTAGNQGYRSLYRVDTGGRFVEMMAEKVFVHHFELTTDGEWVIFSGSKTTSPPDLFALNIKSKKITQITNLNKVVLSGIKMNEPEEIWFEGGDGIKNHSFVILPPGFKKDRKYPLIYLVHGGPQGAWSDSWSTRWNPQVWAAQGYIVALPNPTGSTGYGQAFTDAISKDWGGRVYEDLMKGLDAVIARYPVDTTRMAAAGASYGGYMMNWFQGHTTRFKTLISHAGVYNLSAMYGTTEEVWFPHWEFGGAPWENPEQYKKWSPSEYVTNFSTPTLIIHGALDYRVPEAQAFEYFTALQYMDVPSKMLYFPNENHWILKPQNSRLWHDTIFDWLKTYLK